MKRVGLRLELARERLEEIFLLLHDEFRVAACRRFDPADACRDAALFGDFKVADRADPPV